MEFCTFHIWKSGWHFTQWKMEFSNFTYENVSAEFMSWNSELFVFYFMKICMLSFLHEIWYFLYFIYESLGGDFLTSNMEISVSQMKIMALVFLRYGEPIWYWSYLYFTNENMCTTVFSWHIKLFVFLISKSRLEHSFMEVGFLYISHLKIRMEIFL